MLTQTELVSKKLEMQVESQKGATKTGKGRDRGQEERQQGTGPWLALYLRPADLAEGVWTM